MPARATRPAVRATLTIALGAEARSSGSSASVRRTCASKLISIVRRTFSQPPSAKRGAPGRAGVVDEQVQAPVALLDVVADARRGVLVGEVDGDPRGRGAERSPRAPAAGPRGGATSTRAAPGSRASRRASASPIPLDAPVMTMTLGCGMDEEPRGRVWRTPGAPATIRGVRVLTTLLGGLALVVGTAAPALATPARDAPARAVAAACAEGVERSGTFMPGMDVRVRGTLPPVVARRKVVVPPCEDTVPAGPTTDAPRTEVLYERRGIPPSVALFRSATQRRGGVHLYLAIGTYPQQRDHPLHRYLYRSPRTPDATKGRRCKPATVTALVPAYDGLVATRAGRQVAVTIDAATRIAAPRVDGVPRLSYGKSVRVRGVDCGAHGGLVARVVTQPR